MHLPKNRDQQALRRRSGSSATLHRPWAIVTLALLVAGSAVALVACGSDDDRDDGDSGIAIDSGTGDGGTDAGASDTWGNFAGDFFATYCTSCHSSASRDYRTILHVERDAATIRCGVSDVALDGCGAGPPPRQFPVGSGPKPSDEERQRIVAWIDASLPE